MPAGLPESICCDSLSHALSFALTLSAEGDVSPNEFGRYHSFDVCPTTDGSHMVIIIRNQRWIVG